MNYYFHKTVRFLVFFLFFFFFFALYPDRTRSILHEMPSTIDFPGGPVGQTLHFHYRGHKFNPWLGN